MRGRFNISVAQLESQVEFISRLLMLNGWRKWKLGDEETYCQFTPVWNLLGLTVCLGTFSSGKRWSKKRQYGIDHASLR